MFVSVKGVNFYGPDSEYVVSGSDDGHVYVWDKHTTNIVQWIQADQAGVVSVIQAEILKFFLFFCDELFVLRLFSKKRTEYLYLCSAVTSIKKKQF